MDWRKSKPSAIYSLFLESSYKHIVSWMLNSILICNNTNMKNYLSAFGRYIPIQ